ncbi:MAG: tRNA-dihydrouridine synthase [Candidatus Magasanikiibacteriota bacterium]
MSWFDKVNKQPILALAPMADMTDSPFCRVCREVERGEEKGKSANFVVFREMVSAEAIVRGNEKTLRMCEFDEIEPPIVWQLFGNNSEVITRAAVIIKERFLPASSADRNELFGIDINMGCPVPKIAGKSNSGASLMKDHDRAVEIVKALKSANLGVPVSVKTRLGWTKDDEILEFAQKLEQAGVDAISIHGRTKKQGYSGTANWERIGEVKKLVKIPVIANGDINSSEDIKRCLEITGADGVMIGRGALGNPWLLSRYPDNPDIQMVKDVVLRHAELHLAHYGEKSMTTFRKHLLCYFKNIPGSKELRMQLVKVSTLGELQEILHKLN